MRIIHNRHFYDLMTIKTRDKSYKNIANDTAIVEIIEYFEKKGTRDEQSEAYYYGGRVYREMGDLPQSLDYFQKALDVLGDAPSRLKGKISSQMGQMFMSMYMFEHAKPRFQAAIATQAVCADSLGMMYNYRNLGECYQWLKQNDSVIQCYDKSLEIAQKTGSQRNIVEQTLMIVEYYLKVGSVDKAISLYSNIEESDFITDYAYIIGIKVAINSGDYNKAESLSKTLSERGSIYSKKFAYNTLRDIAKYKGDKVKYHLYIDKYSDAIDSIQWLSSRDAVIHQNSFYNYSLREKENQVLREYKNKTTCRKTRGTFHRMDELHMVEGVAKV